MAKTDVPLMRIVLTFLSATSAALLSFAKSRVALHLCKDPAVPRKSKVKTLTGLTEGTPASQVLKLQTEGFRAVSGANMCAQAVPLPCVYTLMLCSTCLSCSSVSAAGWSSDLSSTCKHVRCVRLPFLRRLSKAG